MLKLDKIKIGVAQMLHTALAVRIFPPIFQRK